MLSDIVVSRGKLRFHGAVFKCAIGKAGLTEDKREGDHATPLGRYPLRELWYRPDRLERPETLLTIRRITRRDGWCDDPSYPKQYNRHVTLPFAGSHEKLWREDGAYDLIVPLGYNDENPVPGKGSAIFLHCAKDGYPGTEGCIALERDDLLMLLPLLGPGCFLRIEA